MTFQRPSYALHVLLFLGLCILSACGRKEAPKRPGDQTILFPRVYPPEETENTH